MNNNITQTVTDTATVHENSSKDDLRVAVITGLSIHSVLIVIILVLVIIILKKLGMIPSLRASRRLHNVFSAFSRKTSENHSHSCPPDNKELDYIERQHHNYPQDYNDGQDYDDRQDYNDRRGHRESQKRSTGEAIYGNYLNGGVLSRNQLQPEDTSLNGPNLAGPSDTTDQEKGQRYYNFVPPNISPRASAQESTSPGSLYFVLEPETGSDVEKTTTQDDQSAAKLYGNIKVKQAKNNKNKKVNKYLSAESEMETQYANSPSADGDLSMGRVGNAQPQKYHRIVFNGKEKSAFDISEAHDDDDASTFYSRVRSKAQQNSPTPGKNTNTLTEAL